MNWHNLSAQEAAKELSVNTEQGLTSKEAAKRQKKYGYNVLDAQKEKSILARFFSQFSDFMIIILIIAAFISFFVSLMEGHADYVDPLIIFAIILLNAFLGVIQETKAEKSLDALKKLAAPNAMVLRDGMITTLPSKELVPGDIIHLEAGQFIPADARLLTSINLKVDESALTGESHPVEKDANALLKADTPLADRKNFVPSTGIVTYGRGTAIVTATGMHTEVGHIAKLIMEDTTVQTPLQKRLAKTSKGLGIACLIICVVIFVMGILKKRPIFDMFMTSVSLAVAAIPEGLPAIITIMLSLGVQRMAGKKAIIRKLPAVETLGSATVICSDKTGTLTKNQMTVTSLSSAQGAESLSGSFGQFTFTLAALCNDAKLEISSEKLAPKNSSLSNRKNTEKQNKRPSVMITGEPTEKAIVLAAEQIGINKSKLDSIYKRVYEIPFDSSRKMMTTVHQLNADSYRVITKGAPDMLLELCRFYFQNNQSSAFTNSAKRKVLQENARLAGNALRVLAVAYKDIPTSIVRSFLQKEDTTEAISVLENGLTFTGLIGMIDPPRDGVKEAVITCKTAGIIPVMITGDHVETACAIAKDIGILSPGEEAISGSELSKLSEEVLAREIKRYRVFARVTPYHKVSIVKAFQKNGEIVAMTGDGINDAPALKAADVGCSMGIGGTDVAKNASDMILADDNFSTIVTAVEEGRGIYDNIKKSIHFLLSCNIGEIMTIFAAILLGLPSPLIAVQLLWVNLVTDSLPAISLGLEPPERDIMKRKPVPPSAGLFADGLLMKIAVEGMLIGSLALSAFVIGIRFFGTGSPSDSSSLLLGRTMAFGVLSLSQLFHAFNMRSNQSLFHIGLSGNPKLLFSFLIGSVLQISVIMIPYLSGIFKIVPLTLPQLFLVIGLSIIPIPIVELQKRVNQLKHF